MGLLITLILYGAICFIGYYLLFKCVSLLVNARLKIIKAKQQAKQPQYPHYHYNHPNGDDKNLQQKLEKPQQLLLEQKNTGLQEQLQAAYRQGFQDGLKQRQQYPR